MCGGIVACASGVKQILIGTGEWRKRRRSSNVTLEEVENEKELEAATVENVEEVEAATTENVEEVETVTAENVEEVEASIAENVEEVEGVTAGFAIFNVYNEHGNT